MKELLTQNFKEIPMAYRERNYLQKKEQAITLGYKDLPKLTRN